MVTVSLVLGGSDGQKEAVLQAIVAEIETRARVSATGQSVCSVYALVVKSVTWTDPATHIHYTRIPTNPVTTAAPTPAPSAAPTAEPTEASTEASSSQPSRRRLLNKLKKRHSHLKSARQRRLAGALCTNTAADTTYTFVLNGFGDVVRQTYHL